MWKAQPVAQGHWDIIKTSFVQDSVPVGQNFIKSLVGLAATFSPNILLTAVTKAFLQHTESWASFICETNFKT